MWEFFENLSARDAIFMLIGVMIALFIVAVIRYLFDRSGGYF